VLDHKIPAAKVNFVHLWLPKGGDKEPEESDRYFLVVDTKDTLKVPQDRSLVQIKGKRVVLGILRDNTEALEESEDSEKVWWSEMGSETKKLVNCSLVDKSCAEHHLFSLADTR